MSQKLSKYYQTRLQVWLAVLTFVSLFLLVGIQVTWILNAANLEEQNFNHRVALALRQVKGEIGKRAKDCDHMKNYLCGHKCESGINQEKVNEVDSIIKAVLDQHDIKMKYDFFVGDSTAQIKYPNHKRTKCYLQSLNGLIEKDGIRIGMQFPERNQFVFAQLKGWFVVSIVVLVFIGLSFYVMLRLFLRERALMVQTTDFINNMVHEFQTPITNMRLATNLIRKREALQSDTKALEYTNIILSENAKMESNVSEILKIASLKYTEVDVADIDMHELIDKTVCLFELRANTSGGQIGMALNATRFIVNGNGEHFKLMVSNLIDNALKYSPDKPIITVSTRNDKQNLIIEVADNGIGIDKPDMARVFDKYYRVSTGNVHNIKGFGLGLAFVKQIAQHYNGYASVVSQLGKGSTFIVQFPLAGEK
jgi:two-component system, OmpR family, phosphate regulon sensor histidine kinase PhoR